jgi:ubiquinone/menaquinone biosynthesis C-methylase UbiE
VDLQSEYNALFSSHYKDQLDAAALETPPFLHMAKTAVQAFTGGVRGPILQAPLDDGRATTFLAPHVTSLVGISEDRHLVDLASDRVKRRGLENVALQFGNIRHLPFPDASLAGVYCQDHLSHLHVPSNALREMIRVCRHGGHIVAEFLAPQDATRNQPGMVRNGSGFEDKERKIFYRYYEQLRVEEGAAKLQRNLEEKVWENDDSLPSEDALKHRHSWLVVIRVARV